MPMKEFNCSGRIGLIDADLLDGGTRFPNLALMKISSYLKKLENTEVELIEEYSNDLLENLLSFMY